MYYLFHVKIYLSEKLKVAVLSIRKNNKELVYFGVIYLICFTILYTSIFFDIIGWFIVYFLLFANSLLSLIAVLLLLKIERKRKKSIHLSIYVILSVILFSISFFTYKKVTYDPRNLFPIFEEPFYVIIILCIVSNLFSIGSLFLIKKIGPVLFKE